MTEITPLQEYSLIELELHEKYGEIPPSQQEIADYIKQKKFPISDAGLTISIH